MKTIDDFYHKMLSSFYKEPGDNRQEAGLNIYRWNFLANHIDILANNYAACFKLLGSNNFKYFAKSFLENSPPQVPNIETYGSGFDRFLADRRELDSLGYLGALAQLDWLWCCRFHHPQAIQTWRNLSLFWQSLVAEEDFESELDPDDLVTVSLKIDGDQQFYFLESELSE